MLADDDGGWPRAHSAAISARTVESESDASSADVPSRSLRVGQSTTSTRLPLSAGPSLLARGACSLPGLAVPCCAGYWEL